MLFFLAVLIGLSVANYTNPIIYQSLPDPTTIRVSNGLYYVYATEDTRNVPIYRSSNLVKWEFVGTAFTNQTRPNFISGGTIWAPDINYIKGLYVLYMSMAITNSPEHNSGIGVSYSEKPEGPFTVKGKLFLSDEIGVVTAIDQTYIEDDDGKGYLAFGSFHGIYLIELESDGLSVKSGAQKRQIAGNSFEGSYIFKRGNYWYYFGSIGQWWGGTSSTYRVIVGRSTSLFGPYVDKTGKGLLNEGYTVILNKNSKWVGNGHNSKLVQDDAGNDWLLYHGYDASNADAGRLLLMDRLLWDSDGWPYIQGGTPSLTSAEPVIK